MFLYACVAEWLCVGSCYSVYEVLGSIRAMGFFILTNFTTENIDVEVLL